MKKVLLLGLAAISAILCAEVFVAKIIGYPAYGLEMKMTGIRGTGRPVNVFKPHAKYWTVEGGNKVYRMNNIGLPGVDVKVSRESKYIFVLGSSYIEAYQLVPEAIATSVFQNELQERDGDHQVLNLGIAGQDPYDLYWRANYYERTYLPARVYLVVDSIADDRFHRHPHPLNFDSGLKVPAPLHSRMTDLAIFFMNKSTFVNLALNLVLNRTREESDVPTPDGGLTNSSGSGVEDLEACLLHFQEKYRDRFALISMVGEENAGARIRRFCDARGVRFVSRNVLLPQYRLNGKGHLNAEGNKILARALFDAFIQ